MNGTARVTSAAQARRPLRVAHVLPFVGVGGTEQGARRLATAVGALDVESVALCLDSAPAVHAFFREGGMETLPWHQRDVASWGRGSYAYRTARLGWELRRRGTHVLHCADTFAVTPQIVHAARLAGAALVCHVRNRNERFDVAHTASLDSVRRFVFVSQATWRQCGYSVDATRGTVVYDGVDVADAPPSDRARQDARTAVRHELGIRADAPLLGMVARVEPQKDLPTLVRATARLVAEFPDLHVVVIGGTDATPEQRAHFPEVQRLVAECGVASHLHFLGFRADVPRLVRALDVSVLSTHWEGLPLVLWEAMAEAVPVVATAVDGIPEAIRDGVTGLLVRHADDAQLAERVAGLLRAPGSARALGLAGMAHARATFSTARFAEQMRAVYDGALGRR